MDRLKIQLVKRVDKNGDEYFVTTTHVPVLLDLSKSVIHGFDRWDENDELAGIDLIIRHYDPNHKSRNIEDPPNHDGPRRRRRPVGGEKEEGTE